MIVAVVTVFTTPSVAKVTTRSRRILIGVSVACDRWAKIASISVLTRDQVGSDKARKKYFSTYFVFKSFNAIKPCYVLETTGVSILDSFDQIQRPASRLIGLFPIRKLLSSIRGPFNLP